MHRFDELVTRCIESALSALEEVGDKIHEALNTSGATSLVKGLQTIQLQKAILAVGMFSMFEAKLQDGLNCSNGFGEARKILSDEGETALKTRFDDFQTAINVLKHGRGRSYDDLAKRATKLPFRIKSPDESFFEEGDVSEISTLIEVDDDFVRACARLVHDVSAVIRRARPNYFS